LWKTRKKAGRYLPIPKPAGYSEEAGGRVTKKKEETKKKKKTPALKGKRQDGKFERLCSQYRAGQELRDGKNVRVHGGGSRKDLEKAISVSSY